VPAYLIANIPFSDTPDARAYRERVPAVIAHYGGRYVVRGGPIEVLEGASMDGRRIVVVEFPDRETVHRFYESPEYQAIIALRQGGATGDLIVVDGYPG
jgi:uncharacterized protein (DUF1330 family)